MERIRIFVASPDDVLNERTRIKGVIESLNNGLANHLDIVLELKDWSQVLPDMGRGQGVIFEQIPVESWDVLIGILWLRYGSASDGVHSSESGTHEEFRVAYELWKKTQQPRIMFYRCTRPPDDITKINMEDLGKINSFFKEFETGGKHRGLYKTYDTPESFERLIRDHLEKLLIDYSRLKKKQYISNDVIERFSPKLPNTLPRRAAFFGREAEIEKVLGAIGIDERGWGVVIDGIGGIGKTALAIEAAYRAKEKGIFDAFVFITAKKNILGVDGIRDLEPAIATIDSFINETARIINQPGIAYLVGDEKKRALIDALRNSRSLLIYDNLETLTDTEQKGLADFLRFLPQSCKGIVTSRRRGGDLPQ
jgi:hypothetical protein